MGILSAFRFAFQNLFFSPILYGVIASLALFSTVWEQGDRLKDQLTDRFRSQDDTFDFIIVGGGSAGAVLANRLSQFHTVLLLEAGGETHPFQAIPGLSIFIPKHPGTDWMHKSVPQSKSCFSCRHKKYILSQGKNLGGTGNLNYMVHLRGNPLDFDNWATITGDPTWGYNGVLPYFIKSENFVGKTTDDNAHGSGGPLQIQIPDCTGLADEWNQAGVEMGYQHVDLNGRHSEGFDTIFYPIKHGVRQATYRAYIQPVRNRASLLIRKFAHVNKVLIREGTNEAYGVEYDRHGHRKHAFANKEVILSAGTLQTPKLLTLSGVGQLEHLQALHIPVRSVLPVGKNLQDHFSTLLGPFYINQHKTISFDRDVDKRSFITFATSGKGPLSTTGFQATALVASSIAKSQGQDGWPDIQLTLFGLTPHRMFYSDIGHAFGIREEVLHRYYGDARGKENAFFIMVTLARPLSKGDFCVPNKNPYRPPVIDPNYLNDAEGHDIKVLIEGIHRALFLAENTTVFRQLETVYSQKCFPGCENIPFRSDVYWECYARSFSIANNDHVGTCAMGQVGSPYAVVDPELQVQGVKRLRVVDASVFPTITGTPTQAATIMIAEKASTLILERWKNDAKTFYGPPGQRPGNPLFQYGPPGRRPGQPVAQYGPPPSSKYGVPGLRPPPVAGGDGFANYDSFSVIRDQLNPTPGAPGSTPLIPLQPITQVWSTPKPFEAASPTPTGFGGNIGIGSTPGPLLTPEPSVLLLPPETLPDNGPPPYATSYQSSNIDFNSNLGPIISTTPDYNSFTLDTSRSEKSFVSTEGDNNTIAGARDRTIGSNITNQSSRRGKAFNANGAPALEQGNQLDEGFDEETTTPAVPTSTFFPEYFSTTQQPPFRVTSTEIITQGPGFRVVRKRIQTTPRVVVHPRGHLGHQNVHRKPMLQNLNESLENLFLTTSSPRPVPKEIVKIRRRRPVPLRRRTTTTTPPPTNAYPSEDIAETTAYSNNDLDFSSTSSSSALPPSEIPIELKSPGRKRFVRRMFARPLNFNGRKRFPQRRRSIVNDLDADTTTFAPIIVTSGSNVVEVTVEANDPSEPEDIDEEIQEKPEKVLSIKQETEGEEADENFTEPPNSNEDLTEDNVDIKNDNLGLNATDDDQQVVVFKNIELEDVDELTRQTRSHSTNNSYFEYSLLTEENRNPIMPLDLNPIPQIIAPKINAEGGVSGERETVAIDMSKEKEMDVEETTLLPNTEYDQNIFANVTKIVSSSKEDGGIDKDELDNISSLTSDEISQISYDINDNSSSSINLSFKDKDKNGDFNIHKIGTESPAVLNSTSVSVSVSETRQVGPPSSSYEDEDDYVNPEERRVERATEKMSTTTALPIPTIRSSISSTIKLGNLPSRFNFRVRNKLMRIHS